MPPIKASSSHARSSGGLGKGHEAGQIVGDTVLPFDDVAVAQAAIAAVDGTGSDAVTGRVEGEG